jgi:hypothetical protein
MNRDPFAPGGVMDAPDLQLRIALNRRAGGLPLSADQERRIAVRQGLEAQSSRAAAGNQPPGISSLLAAGGDVRGYTGSIYGAPGSYTAARPGPGISSLLPSAERSADLALRARFGDPPNERVTVQTELPAPADVARAFSSGTAIPPAQQVNVVGGIDIADATGSRFLPGISSILPSQPATAAPTPSPAAGAAGELPPPNSIAAHITAAPVDRRTALAEREYAEGASARATSSLLNSEHLTALRRAADDAAREQKAFRAAAAAYIGTEDPVGAYLEAGGSNPQSVAVLMREKGFEPTETTLPSGAQVIKNTPRSVIPNPMQQRPTRAPETELARLIRERAAIAKTGNAEDLAHYDRAISNYKADRSERPLTVNEFFASSDLTTRFKDDYGLYRAAYDAQIAKMKGRPPTESSASTASGKSNAPAKTTAPAELQTLTPEEAAKLDKGTKFRSTDGRILTRT